MVGVAPPQARPFLRPNANTPSAHSSIAQPLLPLQVEKPLPFFFEYDSPCLALTLAAGLGSRHAIWCCNKPLSGRSFSTLDLFSPHNARTSHALFARATNGGEWLIKALLGKERERAPECSTEEHEILLYNERRGKL